MRPGIASQRPLWVGVALGCLVALSIALTPAAALGADRPVSPVRSLADAIHALPPAQNSEAKLQPNTVNLLRVIETLWPYYASEGAVYGWREDPIADHPSGQALDIMMKDDGRTPTSVQDGHQIAAFLMVNAKQLGVNYMVWRQQIWYPGKAWRLMGDNSNWTDNHMNHIHVLVDGQNVPEGSLIKPAPFTSPDDMPTIEGALRSHQQQLAALTANVALAKKQLKATAKAVALLKAGRSARAGDVRVAQRTITQVVRETYMFGVDIELVSSAIGILSEPSAVGMAQLVAEHESRQRQNDYDTAKVELVRARDALAQADAALTAATEAVKAAEQAHAEALASMFHAGDCLIFVSGC